MLPEGSGRLAGGYVSELSVGQLFGFPLPGCEAMIAQIIIVPTVVAELAFVFWLLIRRVNVERYYERTT
ncbi:hypothetical protein RxyAA322_16490 [Rubrobacter xylanophilus]|uniref:Uncharacterized protein n=1 Tax=Rubrobacter xylanophilus TaxID=49319 RepID=A0A510HKH5_9ACTN|nr:hypothetical protein RxyAA322_16490 [Rubrobacter xylanophilus]